MKLILILSAVLLLFTVPAFSELTVEDLEKIRSIIKEEIDPVKEEIAKSETRMKAEIVAVKEEVTKSEARMKEYVNVRISEMDKRLNNIFTVVLGLGTFIAVVIGVPQLVVAMQRKDIRAQDAKIEAQQKQIEALLQDMETRKQERIVKP